MKKRILVAEDEEDALQGLVDILESEGYEVEAAADGSECIDCFKAEKFDLLLLDVMMPEQSGYDVCRQIRGENRHIPIILLTAKSEEIDKVVGFELGADDYITKPFGIRELLARVKAALRRSEVMDAQRDKHKSKLPETFDFGPALVNRKQYKLEIGGKSKPLTARELTLLEFFAEHPDEVLSRDDLLNAVWGIDYMGTTRTLDQHIAQLRKKVELNPNTPSTIVTVHGIGYRYSQVGDGKR